jgi:hypothetical protein
MTVRADKAGLHVAKCATEYMDHNSLKGAPNPPYSPDLAPPDFCIFGYLKHQLQGREFTDGAGLVSALSKKLNQIPTDTLADVFDNWMRFHNFQTVV